MAEQHGKKLLRQSRLRRSARGMDWDRAGQQLLEQWLLLDYLNHLQHLNYTGHHIW